MSVNEIPVAAAFILGLLTAISPCTLAATISGAAFITRSMNTPKYALLVGILLSTGRMITFFVIGSIMIAAGHTIGEIALFSQNVGTILLGCVLFVVGVVFLDVVPVDIDVGGGFIANMAAKTHAFGLLGAVFLGALYGLAFCPYSAALFFGMLIPLAVSVPEGYVLPVLFGLGVNIPVLLYSGMVYMGSSKARSAMQMVSKSWTLIGRLLGVILISASLYYLGPYISLKTGVSFSWLPYVVGGILLAGVLRVHVRGSFS